MAGDGTVRIFDVADGRQLFLDRSYSDDDGWGVFSPDGNHVAILRNDTVLDLTTLESRTILPSCVGSLAWSPDGKTIAAGFGPGTVKLIDVATGEILAHSHNHERGITAIAFSPDGLTMATGSDDHTVRIWDARTRQELATFEGHTGTIQCLTFSPDSKTLVTSAQRPDGQSEVRIWPGPSKG